MNTIVLKILGVLAASAFVMGLSSAAAQADRADKTSARAPVVVELFTSQGCNTCPPADKFLGVLAKRKDVIALSFHVDYWNYLGWKDPYSLAAATKRQRAYRWALRQSTVYTPQMVIDGRYQAVGSRTLQVRGQIERAKLIPNPVDVRLSRRGGRLNVSIEAPTGAALATGAIKGDIWLFVYDKHHKTAIGAGENSGRTLNYYNVVRTIRRLDTYAGKGMSLSLDAEGLAQTGRTRHDGAVVVVQAPRRGPILGAAKIALR